jgi:hypothetical protein
MHVLGVSKVGNNLDFLGTGLMQGHHLRQMHVIIVVINKRFGKSYLNLKLTSRAFIIIFIKLRFAIK